MRSSLAVGVRASISGMRTSVIVGSAFGGTGTAAAASARLSTDMYSSSSGGANRHIQFLSITGQHTTGRGSIFAAVRGGAGSSLLSCNGGGAGGNGGGNSGSEYGGMLVAAAGRGHVQQQQPQWDSLLTSTRGDANCSTVGCATTRW